MSPTEYKALKAQLESAQEAVKKAQEVANAALATTAEKQAEEYRVRHEVEKWEPMTKAQTEMLLLIYRNGGKVTMSQWNLPRSYYIESPNRTNLKAVVIDGLNSRHCFGPPERTGTWSAVYRLSEHSEVLARALVQEGE